MSHIQVAPFIANTTEDVFSVSFLCDLKDVLRARLSIYHPDLGELNNAACIIKDVNYETSDRVVFDTKLITLTARIGNPLFMPNIVYSALLVVEIDKGVPVSYACTFTSQVWATETQVADSTAEIIINATTNKNTINAHTTTEVDNINTSIETTYLGNKKTMMYYCDEVPETNPRNLYLSCPDYFVEYIRLEGGSFATPISTKTIQYYYNEFKMLIKAEAI